MGKLMFATPRLIKLFIFYKKVFVMNRLSKHDDCTVFTL